MEIFVKEGSATAKVNVQDLILAALAAR
jgi:hypothetical protein